MERDTRNQFGKYIKQLRQGRRLSIRELANKTGIDSGALTRIEHGKVGTPRPETLKALAKALDTRLADMFARAGYTTPTELPDLATYLRLRYSHLSEEACASAEKYLHWLIDKHGPSGDSPSTSEYQPSTQGSGNR